MRYLLGARRSISANYRYTRNASEQLDLGWQWPLAGRKPPLGPADAPPADPLNLTGQRSAGSGECGGTWYSVGRLSYSLRESRLTDSLFGVDTTPAADRPHRGPACVRRPGHGCHASDVPAGTLGPVAHQSGDPTRCAR
ncbi:MAG: hypothetical protein QM742_18595 [Aquabacterium sp.]